MNLQELKNNELLLINGGTDPDGCAGCSVGAAFREWLSDAWSSFADGWAAGSSRAGRNFF